MIDNPIDRRDYEMQFDVGSINHLGLQMYSTLPSVISELVANSWDANATKVEIVIPESPLNSDECEIILEDNGIGMSDEDIRKRYLVIGRDRRAEEEIDKTPLPFERNIMGRKGIGKLSSFGIAKEIEIESVKGGETSRLVMNYDKMLAQAESRTVSLPALKPTNTIEKGTRITLRRFTKFKERSIQINRLRKGLARRFSIIDPNYNFEVIINKSAITPEERDLKSLLDTDTNGEDYLWEFDNEKIQGNDNWSVSGWIGALKRTTQKLDGIGRGIVLMARGKLVQEPFVFEANVGQQYALSYLIGELHVEFVDAAEDTIATNRNTLVWDTEANEALKEWGQKEVNKIAREWSNKRATDNRDKVEQHKLYQNFKGRAQEIGNNRSIKLVDKLVRKAIEANPTATTEKLLPIIEMAGDFLEFDKFWEIAADLNQADITNPELILNLFKEWQVVEALEMTRIANGRIATIKKFEELVKNNTLEVPTLHRFFKEFPWTMDPRWTLVDDEITYSELLRKEFPESMELPEKDRRIDFLCIQEHTTLVVVEIKRPNINISRKDLNQLREYIVFTRSQIVQSSDVVTKYKEVVGYLLCGGVVNKPEVRIERDMLEKAQIYVRLYTDLLKITRQYHRKLVKKYEALKQAKSQPH